MAVEINSSNLPSKNSIRLVHGLRKFCLLLTFLRSRKHARMKFKLIFTAKSPRPGEIFCKPSYGVYIDNTTSWIESAHRKIFNRVENEESYNFCLVNENSFEKDFNYSGNVNHTFVKCLDFEHRPTFYSIIHQYALFCSREAHVALSQSFHLLGVLIGGIIAFYMLKRYISLTETILLQILVVGHTQQNCLPTK